MAETIVTSRQPTWTVSSTSPSPKRATTPSTELLAGLADRMPVERRPEHHVGQPDRGPRSSFGTAIAAQPPGPRCRAGPSNSVVADEPDADPQRACATTSIRPRDGGPGLHPGLLRAAIAPGLPLRRQVAPLDLEFDRFGQVRALPSGDLAAPLRPGPRPGRPSARSSTTARSDRALGVPDHPARHRHARGRPSWSRCASSCWTGSRATAPSWWPGRTWTRCSAQRGARR